MEDIDIEKIKELLDVVRESGALAFQYKDIVVQFGGPVVTDARGTEVWVDATDPEATGLSGPQRKPVGYTAIFGSKLPTFKNPSPGGSR